MLRSGTTPIERFARSGNGALRRWLLRSFGAKLSHEDIADVIGEAYADAVADAGGLADEELRPWMYRVARNRAIGRIRRLEGEGAVKRSTVSLSLFAPEGDEAVASRAPVAAMVTDDEAAHEELAGAELARADARVVHRALERLPDTEREVLRICAIDGISIRGAVELTGLSKKQVENTRARAIARFRTLVGAPMSSECGRARRLIQPGHLVAAPLARWRDAHLAGCLGCQVQGDAAYGKRLQGIAPLLPVAVPALGPLEALWAKVAIVVPFAGRLPAEAGAAGISSGGTRGLLGAGTGVKLGAVAILAAGAATPVIHQSPPPASAPAPRVASATAPPAVLTPDRRAATSRRARRPNPRQERRPAKAAPRSSRMVATPTPTPTPTATPTARPTVGAVVPQTRGRAASPAAAPVPRPRQASSISASPPTTDAFGREFSP